MNEINVKQGEVKTVVFTVTLGGEPYDLRDVTLAFQVKRHKGETSALISKIDAQFDKSQAQNGIVAVQLESNDTSIAPGTYVGELKLTHDDGRIDKSDDIQVIVRPAVIRP